MKRPINHTMVKIDEVIQIVMDLKDSMRQTKGSSAVEISMIDDAMRKIRSLDARKRLVVIEGGRK